jgi:hypothetical protein
MSKKYSDIHRIINIKVVNNLPSVQPLLALFGCQAGVPCDLKAIKVSLSHPLILFKPLIHIYSLEPRFFDIFSVSSPSHIPTYILHDADLPPKRSLSDLAQIEFQVR